MKNLRKIFLTLSGFLLFSSFTINPEENVSGTFGDETIKLIINTDHSFLYTNFSVANQPLIVKGNWTVKNKKVHLSTVGAARYHNTWSISKDGRVAKSHKGLLIYTLHRQK